MNITYKKIIELGVGIDPEKIDLPTDYNDTVLNFIKEYEPKLENKSDLIWTLLREEFLSEQDIILFNLWCAQQVKHLMKDERSLNALIVKEKFAFGKVSKAAYSNSQNEARDASTQSARENYAQESVSHCFSAQSACCSSAALGLFYQPSQDQIKKIIEIFEKPNGEWFVRTEVEK